jgi:putative membrane protein
MEIAIPLIRRFVTALTAFHPPDFEGEKYMGPGHHWWGDMWWGGMWIYPLIILTVILIVVYLIFGRGGWRLPWYSERSDTASEILKQRYARGDISRDEFEQMKKDLVD